MTELTDKQVLDLIKVRRAAIRGDVCETLANAVAAVDARFADGYDAGELPPDWLALRNGIVASLELFNTMANRQTPIPPRPNAILTPAP